MKIFESMLGKLIDRFKASHPKIYLYVIAALTFVHMFALAATAGSLGILEKYPELVADLPAIAGFLQSVPTALGSVIWIVSGALIALTGSSTPPGLGTAQMIVMDQTYEYEGKQYTKGRHYYLKNKVAEYLISRGVATIVIADNRGDG